VKYCNLQALVSSHHLNSLAEMMYVHLKIIGAESCSQQALGLKKKLKKIKSNLDYMIGREIEIFFFLKERDRDISIVFELLSFLFKTYFLKTNILKENVNTL
jgi:hypothetical protein